MDEESVVAATTMTGWPVELVIAAWVVEIEME
jgi:hypothetical protein